MRREVVVSIDSRPWYLHETSSGLYIAKSVDILEFPDGDRVVDFKLLYESGNFENNSVAAEIPYNGTICVSAPRGRHVEPYVVKDLLKLADAAMVNYVSAHRLCGGRIFQWLSDDGGDALFRVWPRFFVLVNPQEDNIDG